MEMSSGSHDNRRVRTFPIDKLAESVVREWMVSGGMLVAPEEDFRGVDLSGIDISECWLTGTNLSNVAFVGADLSYGHFGGAILSGANFSNARIVDADFCDADLTRAVFADADLINSTFEGASMRGCSFVAADLGRASLDKVDLRGVTLSNCRVNNTWFDTWMDDSTKIEGLYGSVFGPAFVTDKDGSRELDETDLSEWMCARGADVEVRTSSMVKRGYFRKNS